MYTATFGRNMIDFSFNQEILLGHKTKVSSLIILPWMTWELSFRKKLYRYFGMKADMQAYANAIERTTCIQI